MRECPSCHKPSQRYVGIAANFPAPTIFIVSLGYPFALLHRLAFRRRFRCVECGDAQDRHTFGSIAFSVLFWVLAVGVMVVFSFTVLLALLFLG